MRKVALFSPNGYVGSNIEKRIKKNEHLDIYGITRDFNWDVCIAGLDVFIYSAAITRERGECPEKYIRDNALMAIKVVAFCRRNQVNRIIYLSSDEIYGKLNTKYVDDRTIMVEPNIYAVTKYLAEKVIMDSGIPYFILRLPGIVGKKWGKGFIYRLMDRISQNEEVTLYNADQYFNNIVDVEDLVEFIELLACYATSDCSEIFLLGNTEKVQLLKLVEYIKRLYHSNSNIINRDNCDDRYFTLDVDKAVAYGYHSKKITKVIEELYQYSKIDKSEEEGENDK